MDKCFEFLYVKFPKLTVSPFKDILAFLPLELAEINNGMLDMAAAPPIMNIASPLCLSSNMFSSILFIPTIRPVIAVVIPLPRSNQAAVFCLFCFKLK